MSDERTHIVIICPVFNEQDNIEYFFDRLQAAIAQADWENTRSSCSSPITAGLKGTLRKLDELCRAH